MSQWLIHVDENISSFPIIAHSPLASTFFLLLKKENEIKNGKVQKKILLEMALTVFLFIYIIF